jgi:hypothetical protein
MNKQSPQQITVVGPFLYNQELALGKRSVSREAARLKNRDCSISTILVFDVLLILCGFWDWRMVANYVLGGGEMTE